MSKSNIFAFVSTLTIVASTLVPSISAAASGSGYVSGRFALELDNQFAGHVESIVSSDQKSDEKGTKLSKNFVIDGSDAKAKWQLIELKFNAGMSKALYNWISAQTGGDYTRHNGAILLLDGANTPVQRLEFTDAVWTRLYIGPATVGASNNGEMSLTISPKSSQLVNPKPSPPVPGGASVIKSWVDGRFSFKLKDFDCSEVSAIAGFTLLGKIVDTSSGALFPSPGASKTGLDDLKVTIPDVERAQFQGWLTAEKGKPTNFDRSGILVFVDADGKPVFTFTFPGFAILELIDVSPKGTVAGMTRYTAQLGFVQAAFSYGSGAVGP